MVVGALYLTVMCVILHGQLSAVHSVGIDLGPYAKGDHVCRSVNEPLNVTCTLSQDAISNGFSSSGLMFVLYTWNENFDTVFFQFTNETVQKVINESTVELLIPRIPGYINNVHLDCKLHLNVTTSDIPSTTHTYRLLIAEKPAQPVLTFAEVDNWESLKITWNGSSGVKALYNDSNQLKYVPCNRANDNSCIIESVFNKSYNNMLEIELRNSNECDETVRVSNHLLSLHDIVRPGSVTATFAFDPSNGNSSDLKVTFSAPKPKSMIYTLIVVCGRGNREYFNGELLPVYRSEIEREINHRVNGIPKYTNCTVSMRALASQRNGRYGPWSHYYLTTPEDVPLAAPQVCSSCFQAVDDLQSGTRIVSIYFKPLSDESARGRVTEYRLLDHVASVRQMYPGHDHPFLTLTLLLNKSYSLILDVKTTNYNPSLHQDVIRIPPADEMPARPRLDVVNFNDSTLLCYWNAVRNARKYILFWCKAQAGNSVCSASAEWVELSSNVTQRSIQLPYGDSVNHLVGIAVEDQRNNSNGITWSTCQYKHDSGNQAGKMLLAIPLVSKHSTTGCCSVTVNITKPACDLGEGYIEAYRIFYGSAGCSGLNEECGSFLWETSEEMQMEPPESVFVFPSTISVSSSVDAAFISRCLQLSAFHRLGTKTEVKTVKASVDSVLVTLDDLKPNSFYDICVQSLSANNRSSENSTLLERTGDNGPDVRIIVLSVVLSAIFLVLTAAAFFGVFRYSQRCWRRLYNWFFIGIYPPCGEIKIASVYGAIKEDVPYSNSRMFDQIPPPAVTFDNRNVAAPLLSVFNTANPPVKQTTGNRLLPVISGEEDEQPPAADWSSQDDQQILSDRVLDEQSRVAVEGMSMLPRVPPSIMLWPLESQPDSAMSAFVSKNPPATSFGYTGGKAAYGAPFSPEHLPNTDPSEVCISYYDSSSGSAERERDPCLTHDDHFSRNDGSSIQRLLPLTSVLPSTKHLESDNVTTMLPCVGDEILAEDSHYDHNDDGAESELCDVDLYSRSTVVSLPVDKT